MPAVITHDFFGRDMYSELFRFVGGSKSEADAFLLGNQGPDPLFYLAANPLFWDFRTVGSQLHNEAPSALILELKQALSTLNEDEYRTGRAYVLGFLCHYALDSNMHPFVYAMQYALCNAGVEGLSERDGSEVHAAIESELDELVLWEKREETIETFDPSHEILRASNETLRIISKLYKVLLENRGFKPAPKNIFLAATYSFRLVQRGFHSAYGIKRAVFGSIEEVFRPHSFYRAMSHRAAAPQPSIFDNHEHAEWANPFTQACSTESFWDLYNKALNVARSLMLTFDLPSLDATNIQQITNDNDFSGRPVAPERTTHA